MAVIEFDPTGTILGANANFLQTSGYEMRRNCSGSITPRLCPAMSSTRRAYKQFW